MQASEGVSEAILHLSCGCCAMAAENDIDNFYNSTQHYQPFSKSQIPQKELYNNSCIDVGPMFQ